MEKNITISDIAKLVGVSKTTVSRYLNGRYEYMSPETREKIEKAISDLNFSPNNFARGLKSKHSNLIGIVTNTLEYQVAAMFIRGIHDVCVEYGYGTIIFCSDNLLTRETEGLKMCLSQQVDAIALIPVNLDCTYYHQIHENGTYVLLCNRYREDWKYDGVFADNVALSKRALEHMLNNGYSRIALFTDNHLRESNKTYREKAFVEFVNNNCGINGQEVLYVVEKSPELIRHSILDFLRRFPNEHKAIFAINTNTLFLTLREIKRMGLDIPHDIGICGYDLIGWAELVHPGITSLEQPFYELGVAAGRQIIQRLRSPHSISPEEIWLDGEIHIRESTKAW